MQNALALRREPTWIPAIHTPPVVDEETRAGMDAIKQAGRAENTERAHRQDLAYLKGWVEVVRGEAWQLPLSVGTVLQFVTFHLAPNPILDARLVAAGVKAKPGPHSLSTIKRRLATLSVAHRGLDQNPTKHPSVREILADSARALAKAGVEARRADALTRDVLDPLLATCDETLLGKRDRALLLVGVSAGGRRRSELVALTMADIKRVEGGYVLTVRRSKTDQTGQGLSVPVRGRAADALTAWLAALADLGVTEGRVFRSVVNGQLGAKMSGNAVSDMIARRARRARIEGRYTAHSIRSGFVSQSARVGVGLLDTMALSGHKSVEVCRRYYRQADTMQNPAGAVFG